MSKGVLDQIRGLSRGERASYLEENRSEILSIAELEAVNGGVVKNSETDILNPGSEESDFNGCWLSSFGFICNGVEIC